MLLKILLVFWGHGLHVSWELATHVVVVGADVVETPVSQLIRAVELSQFQEHKDVPIDVHHHLSCFHQPGHCILLCDTHTARNGLKDHRSGQVLAYPPWQGPIAGQRGESQQARKGHRRYKSAATSEETGIRARLSRWSGGGK